MTEHDLKTWPHEHDAIGDGSKTFEVRSNTDRSFGAGDVLLLHKWDPGASYFVLGLPGCYINKHGSAVQYLKDAHTHRMLVTYILHGGRFGLPGGVCVMGIIAE